MRDMTEIDHHRVCLTELSRGRFFALGFKPQVGPEDDEIVLSDVDILLGTGTRVEVVACTEAMLRERYHPLREREKFSFSMAMGLWLMDNPPGVRDMIWMTRNFANAFFRSLWRIRHAGPVSRIGHRRRQQELTNFLIRLFHGICDESAELADKMEAGQRGVVFCATDNPVQEVKDQWRVAEAEAQQQLTPEQRVARRRTYLEGLIKLTGSDMTPEQMEAVLEAEERRRESEV